MPTAELIAIGTELLLGEIQDTNTRYLARTQEQGQRLRAGVQGAVGRVTGHIHGLVFPERHQPARAGGLVFEQHQPFARQAKVELGRRAPRMEMALGHEILPANLPRHDQPNAAMQIAVAVRGLNGGHGVDQRVAGGVEHVERLGVPGRTDDLHAAAIEVGEERWLKMELKLMADVGLLGFPSVGKSSFIAKVSAARPKIADYPFTTLTPNLGVVPYKIYRTFVMADIPGLIEGAHEGAGLGHRFLRHVERTDILLHMLDLSWMPERDPVREYQALNRELALFDPELAEKPQIIVFNKIDLPHVRERLPEVSAWFTDQGLRVFPVSAATGEGVPALLDEIARYLWGKAEEEW